MTSLPYLVRTPPGPWRRALRSGGAASLLSSAIVVWRSRRENGSPWPALNAVSHWLYGRRAFGVERPTWEHTAPALLIHHVSSLFWGGLFEMLVDRMRRGAVTDRSRPRGDLPLAGIAAGAALVTAIGALTDLRLVPERLSPGFERRLRPASVALVYVGFGVGLALAGAWLARGGAVRVVAPA